MDQLKLAALDAEDLQVLSAHVQDAVLKVGDIRFFAADGHLVLTMNRFVWDKAQGKPRRGEQLELADPGGEWRWDGRDDVQPGAA